MRRNGQAVGYMSVRTPASPQQAQQVQTNILALNAAVEAARAGEAGNRHVEQAGQTISRSSTACAR